MTPPINWDRPDFGKPPHNVHVASESGDKHTDEPEQEASR